MYDWDLMCLELAATDPWWKPGTAHGHPSDVITPLLAVAEHVNASGADFLAAVVLAYEIYLRICDACHSEGFDPACFGGIAMAAATGRLLGLSAEQIAADAWGVGSDGALLAGEIEPAEGTCAGAQWARATDLAEPAVYVPTEATGALAATALARFRQLPAWVNAQEGYRSVPPEDAGVRWDEHGGAHPTVTLWQTTPPGRRYVSVVSHVSTGGCGDFAARVSAVFEAVGNDLVLQSDPNDPGVFDPQAATDADGDGTADFITPAGLFRRRGTVLRWVDRIQWPVLDCYC